MAILSESCRHYCVVKYIADSMLMTVDNCDMIRQILGLTKVMK